METDEFEAKNAAFLSWLSENGVIMNPKMELRSVGAGRGRGAGTLHCPVFPLCLVLVTLIKSEHLRS